MLGKLISMIKSLFKSKGEKAKPRDMPSSTESKTNTAVGKGRFKNTYKLCFNYNPLASIFLWGMDAENNPAFVVLYSDKDVTSNQTVFTSYAIFRGTDGHFPSFDRVRVVEQYDYKTRKRNKKMYHIKDVKHGYYHYMYDSGNQDSFKDFYLLEGKQIFFTHNRQITYSDMLKRLNLSSLRFENFTLAQNPAEILKLPPDLNRYAETIYELFSNTNLYSRKKILKELINSKPPKNLYTYLLKTASGELLSGLFLQLAEQKNPVLADEAVWLSANDLKWLKESHQNGLLRCASLYADSLSIEKTDERIQDIYDNQLKPGFQNIISLKNSVQFAEVLTLADISGRIAYHLDMKKFTFENGTNAHLYFNRYLRRIIDGYATHDDVKFMEAMKALLTSCTKADDFQETKTHYFINRYLYINHNRKERRYEFRPDIWDKHFDGVFDIICVTKIDAIAAPLHYILADNIERLNIMPYEKLICAAEVPYSATADMIVKVISDKLKVEKEFKLDLMIQLSRCKNQVVQKFAIDYFYDAGGNISATTLVNFMFLRDVENMTVFISENIDKFNTNEYLEFLYSIFNNADQFTKQNIIWHEKLIEVLDGSLSNLTQAQYAQKSVLVKRIINDLVNCTAPDNIIDFGEKILFTIPVSEMHNILLDCDLAEPSEHKSSHIFKLLRSIKNNSVPDDEFLLSILESGASRTINTLIQLISDQKVQLAERFSTLVILLESYIVSLNELAKNIFIELPNSERYKLHAMILDSPHKKAYEYGLTKLNELYDNELIPAHFIIEMLEHTSYEVRSYVSDKVNRVLDNLGNGNKELFIYYAKTLLLLPNKVSSGKKNIYGLLPRFVSIYRDKQPEVEALLLDIGGSNIISDSEMALVALAKVKDCDLVGC